MNLKPIRVLLLALCLCLTGVALTTYPAAALDPCSDPEDFEWRPDGCCSDGYTNFRLWQCDGTYWRGTTRFKCGFPRC